jgi:hypothetical protein
MIPPLILRHSRESGNPAPAPRVEPVGQAIDRDPRQPRCHYLTQHDDCSAIATQPKAPRISRSSKRPELEFARDDLAVLGWTTNNPGADDDHFAVIRCGTDPKNLNETAKSPNRLNRTHSDTVFRVRIDGLRPKTTIIVRRHPSGRRHGRRRGEPDLEHSRQPLPAGKSSPTPNRNESLATAARERFCGYVVVTIAGLRPAFLERFAS